MPAKSQSTDGPAHGGQGKARDDRGSRDRRRGTAGKGAGAQREITVGRSRGGGQDAQKGAKGSKGGNPSRAGGTGGKGRGRGGEKRPDRESRDEGGKGGEQGRRQKSGKAAKGEKGGGEEQQKLQPPQEQERRPGREYEMRPRPVAEDREYRGSGKLEGKVGLITGGDSGIGRAVAIAFAREGADVAITYLEEHRDAEETKRLVESEGRRCLALAGDVGDPDFCRESVRRAVEELGGLEILVNNAAEQHPQEDFAKISPEQMERTFRTNIFAHFYMVWAALPHLREGSAIINTTSVTAYRGSEHLVDYASTKGAIVAFTRSLAKALVEKGIRVNGVAPGPIWTPLIPSTFPAEQVETFGADVPMKRPGQPEEVAPSYVFLASDDASYFAGQILHPNGGEVVNG